MPNEYDGSGGGSTYDSLFAYYDLPEVSALVREIMKTVLNIEGFTPSEVVSKGQSIHDSMDGNANFTTPNPALAGVQTHIDTANDKIAAADTKVAAAREAVAARRAAVEGLIVLLRQLAAYVENQSAGDEDKILSAGFSVRAVNNGSTPNASEAIITILSLTATINPGELRLRIKPFSHALYYEAFTSMTPENAESWELHATESRSTVMLTGFTPGSKPYVKVRAKLRDGFTVSARKWAAGFPEESGGAM